VLADGEGAYAAIDCIGGETTGTIIKAIREEGTVFLYGALSGPTATIPIVDLLYKVGQLTNPWSRS
jgi:NADPH:quinone reductase-like Zn-dependent oxidoreductase